ncbi:MAG: hypothetical protein SFU98_09115 [Leptospiraceae bacterium]|nr:hypothetical protein [Leptospiraceae bacterium]
MRNFSTDEIIGQEVAKTYIKFYKSNPQKIPGLLIFHGPSGVGKWSMAERFSYEILCLHGNGCGHCESCKLFLTHSHPDYIQFPESIRIAIGDDKNPEEFTVRWLLSKRVSYIPHTSKYRIVLLPDASRLGDEAETALLKTLEEPPAHTKFIFIIDDLKKLKDTIQSRGIKIPFQYLSKSSIQEISGEKHIYYDEIFGGSLSPFMADSSFIKFAKDKISEQIKDPFLLLKLENWVRAYKQDHPEWEEDFSYLEFLEIVSTLLLFAYSKVENSMKELEAIFEFKNDLHKSIAGLENFLISRLFHKLQHL